MGRHKALGWRGAMERRRAGRAPEAKRDIYLRFAVYACVGVGLLIYGLVGYAKVHPMAGGRTTTGTVTAVSTGESCTHNSSNTNTTCNRYWIPTIHYTVDGENFSFDGPETFSSMTVGGQVKVSYDPGNPASAHDVSGDATESYVYMGLGAFAILAAAVLLLRSMLRARDQGDSTGASEDQPAARGGAAPA